MKHRFAAGFVVAAAVWAGSVQAAVVAKTETINLDRAALVGGTLIEPGTYQIEFVPGVDAVRFVQGKRTVTETAVSLALGQPLYPGNAIHYRTGGDGPDRLVKIVFAGSKLALQFPVDEAGAAETPIATAAERP